MLYYIIGVVLLVVIHALIDATLIKKQIRINHILESIIFGVLWVIILITTVLIDRPKNEIGLPIIISIGYVVITRIGLFDYLLNKFRNLPFTYISPNVDGVYIGTYESKWDEVINKKANLIRLVALISTILNTVILLMWTI